MTHTTRRKAICIGVALIMVAVIVPFPQTVAPAWTVTTLDSTHKPLHGVTVREVWEQYSLDKSSSEEDQITNSGGQVSFPRRTHWSSFVGRFAGCIRQIALTGVEASCGAHSYLVAFGQGIDTMDWQDSSQEDGTTLPWQRSTLILKH